MKLLKPYKIIFLSFLGSSFITGLTFFIFDHWIRIKEGPLGTEHHPLQPWIIRVHTASAFCLLMALGYLIRVHIEPGLKGKRRKPSGLIMMVFFSTMICTALPLLYAGEGSVREVVEFIHTYLGLSLPLFLFIHIRERQNENKKSKLQA
jgi:hypothetical protein